MYFHRISVDRQQLRQRHWDPYRAHQYVYKFFEHDPKRKREFLFRFDQSDHQLRYFILSDQPCRSLQDSSWQMEHKTFQPQLEAGDTLAFSVRVNPTICVKGKRHDMVMHHKWQLRQKLGEQADEQMPPHQELVHQVAQQWLDHRAESHGFRYDAQNLRIENHGKDTFLKTKTRHQFREQGKSLARAPRITMTTLDMTGTLEVTDPEVFREMLFNGIGRGKGFGYGMMLVRRAQ